MTQNVTSQSCVHHVITLLPSLRPTSVSAFLIYRCRWSPPCQISLSITLTSWENFFPSSGRKTEHPEIKDSLNKNYLPCIYLRNLLTHTVNNLLQTLNNVKAFNCLMLNKNSILFTLCVKISKQYLGYYAKYSLFNLKGSKSEVTNIGV